MPLLESGREELAAPGAQAGGRLSGGPILPLSTEGTRLRQAKCGRDDAADQSVHKESHRPGARIQGPDPAALQGNAWGLLCAIGGITAV